MSELKFLESYAFSDSELEPDKGNDKGKHIIDAEPNAIVFTMKVEKEEPEDQRRRSTSSTPRCG